MGWSTWWRILPASGSEKGIFPGRKECAGATRIIDASEKSCIGSPPNRCAPDWNRLIAGSSNRWAEIRLTPEPRLYSPEEASALRLKLLEAHPENKSLFLGRVRGRGRGGETGRSCEPKFSAAVSLACCGTWPVRSDHSGEGSA